MKLRAFPFKILKIDEVKELNHSLEQLQSEISNATQFVEGIKRGELDIQLQSVNGDSHGLSESLVSMREKMITTAEEERQRNWVTEGMAKFADILRNNHSTIEAFSCEVISSLVKYLNANQGCIFILNDEDESEKFLELQACYAYDRKKYQSGRVEIGEGMLGQVFLENEYLYLKKVPQDYVNITSGLGEATPTSVLISPLKINDESYGIIELASFESFQPYQIEFIQRVGENIASTISNVKTSERTKRLLEESQQMAEELRAQEEEMRQNMEELQATQEAMRRNEERTRMIFNNAVDAIVTIDNNGVIDQFNPAAIEMFGYSLEEIVNENISQIIPKEFSSERDNYVDNEEGVINKNIIGKGKEVEGKRKDGRSFPLEIRFQEGFIGDRKVFIGFLRDITEKKKQDNLIKESEAKARSYFANSIDAIITANEEGVVIDSNPAAENIFGYNKGEMNNKPFSDIISGLKLESADMYLNKKRKVKGVDSNGSAFKTEMYLSSADLGYQKLYIAYIRDIRDELKKDRELAKNMMEMEELKIDLTVKEAKSRSYFENSIDAIINFNTEGKILEFNNAAERLFNADDKHQIQGGFTELIQGIDLNNCETYLNSKRKVKARCVQGKLFKTELYLTKVEVNNEVLFVAYIRDISDELRKDKEIARNLMELEELKVKIKEYQN